MLFALGMFVFDSNTALPDSLTRRRDWRHERTDRFGARAASQFTGPGEDRITLAGTLVPELLGDYSSIETLAELAEDGEALPLLDGRHVKIGTFTIDAIDEDKSNLTDDGRARQNAFTITLTRVA
ncbi:oxidoreductase [Novosphingobium sp. FGD1]|uniref:Oxidoreductase n=1 Tax=Novosphingobium silvae TaxID=2692619 RepID=A0A7X4GD34_9SPHN|nr:phage tail protein [Novosphingobium silvae]MYL96418.1 oxidoreductase [Novosphingobium silvae]